MKRNLHWKTGWEILAWSKRKIPEAEKQKRKRKDSTTIYENTKGTGSIHHIVPHSPSYGGVDPPPP